MHRFAHAILTAPLLAWLCITPAAAQTDRVLAPDLAQIGINPQDVVGWTPVHLTQSQYFGQDGSYRHARFVTNYAVSGTSTVALESTTTVYGSTSEAAAVYAATRQVIALTARDTLPLRTRLGDEAEGHWRTEGVRTPNTRDAYLFIRDANVIVLVRQLGIPVNETGDGVLDLGQRIISRINSTTSAGIDWENVQAGQPRPWDGLLDLRGIDPNWLFTNGARDVDNGVTAHVAAHQTFVNDDRQTELAIEIYPSDALAAVALPMSTPSLDAGQIADGSYVTGGPLGPNASYIIRVRRGARIVEVATSGPAESVTLADSASWAQKLEALVDERIRKGA